MSFRKAGLSPWDPRVEQTWLYTLAAASEHARVDVNHTALVINHHHTTVTTREVPIRYFLGRLHHPMSCAMNRLLQRRGFDAFGRFWDGRQPHRMRLIDAAAQMSQLVYQQVQLPAAGLVDKPEEMPGWTFSWDLWRRGRFVRCERPDVYFDPRYAKSHYDLKFVPPPRLLELFEGDVDKLIYWMKQMEKEALSELRRVRRRKRQRVKGADYVLRIHPWDEPRTPNEPRTLNEPRTPRETRRETIPTFRIGARGLAGREMRIRCSKETRGFRSGSVESRKAWDAGDHEVLFPYGTDKIAERHGVRVAEEPGPDALVYAPGPSLEDIQRAYGPRRHSELSAHALEVANEVRDALREEAPLFADSSEASFNKRAVVLPKLLPNATPSAAPVPAPANDTRTPPLAADQVVTQTLHGPRGVNVARPPKRIVVKRTRPKAGRRAADPPSD